MKKRSLFKKILYPLLCVILIQSVFMLFAVYISGTITSLNQNAVSILQQGVENQHNLLQAEMTDRWANFSSSRSEISKTLESYCNYKSCSTLTLAGSSDNYSGAMESIAPILLQILRTNSVNGSFFVFTGNVDSTAKAGTKLPALYFRDYDTNNNPTDYSDLMLKFGAKDVAAKYNIPLATYWSQSYSMTGGEADSFVFEPYNAVKNYSAIDDMNLGYWSSFFNFANESYPVFTYSVPVRDESGNLYGILGIEVSSELLKTFLPSSTDEFSGKGGFALISYDRTTDLTQISAKVKYISGNSLKSAFSQEDILSLTMSDTYDGFYKVNNCQLLSKDVYCAIDPLVIYNTNTPFYNNQLAIASFKNSGLLFGIGESLTRSLLISVMFALVIGTIAIYLAANLISRPVKNIVTQLKSYDSEADIMLTGSSIDEIDQLADVINRLSANSRAVEEKLHAESERYLMALENSQESIIEYNIQDDTMTSYVIVRKNGEAHVETSVEEHFLISVINNLEFMQSDENPTFLSFLKGKVTKPFIVSKDDADGAKHWSSIRGRPVLDADGNPIKVLASVRDITSEYNRAENTNEKSRDSVTGFLLAPTGNTAVNSYLLRKENNEKYAFIAMQLDGLQTIRTNYGLLFTNLLTEEFSNSLRKAFTKDSIIIRGGEIEFFALVKGADKQLLMDNAEQLCSHTKEIFKGEREDEKLSLTIGITIGEEKDIFSGLVRRASAALNKELAENAGNALFYTPECDNAEPVFNYNDMSSIPYVYNRDTDIVNYVFNLFENSNHINSTIELLLNKLGREFFMRRIIISRFNIDLCTGNNAFYWAADGSKSSDLAKHYSRKQMDELDEWAVNDGLFVTTASNVKIPEIVTWDKNYRSLFCSAYDNGRLSSIIMFELDEKRSDLTSTEQKTLREVAKIIRTQISKANSDLASQAKSDFLSRMSHEIRTPMNAIIGMTDIAMADGDISDHTRRCLEKIDTSTKYLLSLINDILDMSRIESGRMNLSETIFTLDEIVDKMKLFTEPQTMPKGINFATDIKIESNCVSGDNMRISQVLINLLGNAVKFTPKDGTITLTIHSEYVNEHWTKIYFSVKDTGIGIAEKDMARIFQAFEQASNDTARKFGGTGLGLSISVKLLAMMNSRLEVESEVGKGSNFFFTLMLPTAVMEKKSEEVKKVVTPHGKRLLIAEDNELNMEIATSLLEMNGFEVEGAENGQLCVEKFNASPVGYYDLILMDINMPVMDGLEATRQIRKLPRADGSAIPIVAMTANAFDDDIKKSIESGMNEHISKPIDVKKVIEVLSKILS